MKLQLLNVAAMLSLLFLGISCGSGNPEWNRDFELPGEFGDYWYQGKAELAKYHLQQARYGELREGHAVLIFVTEDFSRSKQVKLDNQGNGGADVLKVMKLNAVRKFTTGIYAYSTMTSVFTPIYLNEDPRTVKVTTSSQEWCGHTFLQANLRGNKYKVQANSYFESEGDGTYAVRDVLMEDEIWNRIRLHPDNLPTGTLEVLPGSLYCRFKHEEFQPAKAEAQYLKKDGDSRIYQLKYKDLERTLKIEFDHKFPHKILSWEETYPDGGNLMTTRAELDTTIQLDYWNKNKKPDAYLRRELGLE